MQFVCSETMRQSRKAPSFFPDVYPQVQSALSFWSDAHDCYKPMCMVTYRCHGDCTRHACFRISSEELDTGPDDYNTTTSTFAQLRSRRTRVVRGWDSRELHWWVCFLYLQFNTETTILKTLFFWDLNNVVECLKVFRISLNINVCPRSCSSIINILLRTYDGIYDCILFCFQLQIYRCL